MPWSTERTRASCAVPITAGAPELAGAVGTTAAVGADDALVDPAESVAVTATTSVLPTSAAEAVYVAAVADAMSLQPAPVASHARH